MRRLRRTVLALAAGLILASPTSSAPGGGATGSVPEAATQLSALIWPGAASRIDQLGRLLTPELLRDKVVVLAFVSTDCLIPCVVRMLGLAKLARDLPKGVRDRTMLLALSVAPDQDDVAALRRFAEGLRIETGELRLVTGDAAGTAAVVAALHYPAAKLPEPPSTVLVFDRRGRIAMAYGGDPLDAPRLGRDIALLQTFEDGVGRPPRAAAAGAAP